MAQRCYHYPFCIRLVSASRYPFRFIISRVFALIFVAVGYQSKPYHVEVGKSETVLLTVFVYFFQIVSPKRSEYTGYCSHSAKIFCAV